MVTLTKVDDAIKFVFENSQHYLTGNGEITVPLNSLTLVVDASNMVTFKKLDGDPFISFNIDESNFADKDALIEFYEEEMTGGAGIPTEEIQQMIDESISGISATSMSAVTRIIGGYSEGSIKGYKAGVWYEKADGSTGTSIVVSAKTNGDINLIDNEITLNSAFTSTLITDVDYVGSANTINFLNSSGETIATIDTTDFVIDGMVEDVRIDEISGETYLVIDFNTASGKQDIQIPLTDIFDPSNYYTAEEVDGLIDDATTIGEYIVEDTLIPKHFWNDENMGCYTEIGNTKSIKVSCSDVLENPYVVIALASDEEFMEGNGYVATVENGSITSISGINGNIAELNVDFNEDTVTISTDSENFDEDGLGVIAVVGMDYEPSSFMDLSWTVREEGKCIDIVTTVLDIPEETVQERLDRIYDDVGKLEDFNPISDVMTLDSGGGIGRPYYSYIGYGTLNYNTYNPLSDETISGNTADVFKFDTKDFKAENNVFKFNQSVISLDALSSLSPTINITGFTDGDVTTNQNSFLFGNCIVIETNPNSTSNYNNLSLSISGPNNKSGNIYISRESNRGITVEVSYGGKSVSKSFATFDNGDTLVVDLRNDWGDTRGTHTLTAHNEMESDLISSIKFYNANAASYVPLSDVAQTVLNGHYPTYAELKEELKVKADIESTYTYEYGDESAVTISNTTIYPNAYGFEVYGLTDGITINFYTETNGVSTYNYFTVGEEGEIDRLRSKTYINKELTTYEDGTLKVFVKTTDTVISRIYVSDGNQYDGLVYQSMSMTSMKDDINAVKDDVDGIKMQFIRSFDDAYLNKPITPTIIDNGDDTFRYEYPISLDDSCIILPYADGEGWDSMPTYLYGDIIIQDDDWGEELTGSFEINLNDADLWSDDVHSEDIDFYDTSGEEPAKTMKIYYRFDRTDDYCEKHWTAIYYWFDINSGYDYWNKRGICSISTDLKVAVDNIADEPEENAYGTTAYVGDGYFGNIEDALKKGMDKPDMDDVNAAIASATTDLINTSAITSSVTSASTDSEIPTAKAVFDAMPTGGTGGLDEDTEKLIASALVGLNDTKADISDIKANYQMKGDYATKTELAAKANASEVMTLEKAKENELVTAKALNTINERLIALEAAIQAIQQSNQNN